MLETGTELLRSKPTVYTRNVQIVPSQLCVATTLICNECVLVNYLWAFWVEILKFNQVFEFLKVEWLDDLLIPQLAHCAASYHLFYETGSSVISIVAVICG